MKITTELVKELRQRTGIGIMECKKALEESKGNLEKAILILRKRGYNRAKKKMAKEASEGAIGSYIHLNGKIGVLVEVNCETDFVARNQEFQDLIKNIAMHIAATNPKYLSPENIPQKEIEEEKEIIRAQFKDSGKPPEIIERIVEGKLKKFYEEVCLLNQPYVKDPSMTINQLISYYINKFGENIKIKRFTRYQLGE
ncbi:translation elongation factor Ts [Candidatus Aminicenantes bacterium AH-873-B07]|jgi:elongation factor Ts|nr:translation elongation factor Ts [Candidatus Aminicenantes bacterium AH-873-B07]